MPAQPAQHALVFLGAAPPASDTISDLAFSLVIGVDRGIDHALALGLKITDAVGDFDSVSQAGLAAAQASGATIQRHNPDKDATDLELGLETALARGATEVTIIGAYDTTRLDHQMANLLVMGSPKFASMKLRALINRARIFVVRDSIQIACSPHEIVTLLAVGGPAVGITTQGLEYPLTNETLAASTSRGVSNVALTHEVVITLVGGVLLVIAPGSES